MRQAQQPVPPVSPTPAVPSPAAGPQPAPYVYTYTPGRQGDPAAILRGARAQRDELRDQLNNLEEKRRELSQEARTKDGPDRAGIERRIAEIDQRISEVDKELAAADLQVAKAAAIPGAVVPDPPEPPTPPDWDRAIGITGSVFTFFVLFPLTIAYARRLWRRGALSVAELPKVLAERLTRLDQAVDAIAIEVERISEGQRFLTKVMAEGAGRALGAGPAQPVEVNAHEAVPVPRSTSR
jgi:hypothetical protein